MDNSVAIIWSLLFGSIGIGFFIYGKRQRQIVPLAVGITLFIYPYFISNVYLLVFIGLALLVLPYYVRL